jgi:hypothetical protein
LEALHGRAHARLFEHLSGDRSLDGLPLLNEASGKGVAALERLPPALYK